MEKFITGRMPKRSLNHRAPGQYVQAPQGAGGSTRGKCDPPVNQNEGKDSPIYNHNNPPSFTDNAGGVLNRERVNLMTDLARLFTELLDEEAVQHLKNEDLLMRKDRIERYFQEFERIDREYRRQNPDTSHNDFIKVEEIYMKVMASIMSRTKAIGGQDTMLSSTLIERVDGMPATFRVEMPQPPKVGTFTGKQADWPEFRDKFLAQVHHKDSIHPVDKMTYLQEACQGDAKITLGPWPSTNEGYDGT